MWMHAHTHGQTWIYRTLPAKTRGKKILKDDQARRILSPSQSFAIQKGSSPTSNISCYQHLYPKLTLDYIAASFSRISTKQKNFVNSSYMKSNWHSM